MEYRICIVGTSKPEYDFIHTTLIDAGYIVNLFLSIDEVTYKDIEKYEVVIIRVNSEPKSKGLELAKQIRLHNEGVKIIILTDVSYMRTLRNMDKENTNFAQTYDQVLFLPVSAEELLGNIERVIASGRTQ